MKQVHFFTTEGTEYTEFFKFVYLRALRVLRGKFLIFVLLMVCGCRQDMHDQPKYKPLAQSNFFGDERASRPLVADTVARGHLADYTESYTGKTKDGKPLDHFPFPITAEIMNRG